MLLDPQGDQQFRYPDPERGQAMEAGMAAGADRNQQLAVVDARFPMMDMEPVRRAAGAAPARRTPQSKCAIQTTKTLPAVSNKYSGRMNRTMAELH